MAKTQVKCPNCGQPIVAELEQLFNVDEDPQAKQRILSGGANVVQCPHCGYQGPYPSPLVYHDSEKELMLTFVPSELGLPMTEQERVIGPLINKVVESLPQEKRKAYLLQPKTMLTRQTLVENILEAEGISKEMIQSQQDRLNLIQRLANSSSDEVIQDIVQQEDHLVDQEFFGILNQLVENALASGDQALAQRLTHVQEVILPVTTFGRELQEQSKEIEAAINSLQDFGQELTRDNLLDLVIKAPNEARLQAFVSLARPGMDYQFFQLLSERIDRARGEGRKRLAELREKLLGLTSQYDQRAEAQAAQTRQFLEELLNADNIREELMQNLGMVNEFFVQILQEELESAQASQDKDRREKLEQVINILQELSAASQGTSLINELVDAPNREAREAILEAHHDEVTPELLETLTGLVSQIDSRGDEDLAERVKAVYRHVLRFSMKAGLSK